MNACAIGERRIDAGHRRQRNPLYFPSGERTLFGWLDCPDATVSPTVGVVICRPFGYESLCAYAGIRAFADAAAALGMPVLCFDYAGTGDSEDIGPQVDQIDLWRRDVLAAIAELQRRTGVAQVCLLGFRLGALLAALAASDCEQVTALVAVAPVVSGRRYLRELRVSRLASYRNASAVAPVRGATDVERAETAGGLEANGATLSAATVTSLSQIDLTTRQLPPRVNILIIDRADIPAARSWSEKLDATGTRQQYRVLPGFIEMMMTAPHLGAIPDQMLAAARDWLSQYQLADAIADRISRGTQSEGDASVVLRLAGSESAQSPLVERPVIFCDEPELFGIVTEPPPGELRRRGVILLNSAADHHIGPSRLYVSLARRWARRGYVVLRMDLAGLGDSETRGGCARNDVFPAGAVDDIRAAIEFLRRRYAVRELTLAGLCSGAYHALQGAIAGLPAQRVLLINPRNFSWKAGMKLDDVQLFEVAQYPALYQSRLLSTHYWKRLLSGRVNVRRVLKVYVRRAWLAIEPTLRNTARRLSIHLSDDLGSELEQLDARGVRVVFAFARGDGGDELLRVLAGSSLRRLGQACRIHIIDGADHGFSDSTTRSTLERVLSDELFAPLDPGPTAVRAAGAQLPRPT
jgi:alpha-beta hydrolase superfamily lysophospholipase